MKTRTMIHLTVSMIILLALASCSPSSSKDSVKTYTSADQQTSRSNNIIGGSVSLADYQKANGIVGILMIYEDAAGHQMSSTCTASLIADNVAVTAAHCLIGPRGGAQLAAALIVLGPDFSKVISEVNNDDLSHVRSITNGKIHDLYKQSRGAQADIALVSFDGNLPEGFKIANLATAETARTIRKGSIVTLAGFGVSAYKWDRSTGKPVGSGDGLLRQISGIRVLDLTATGTEITLDQSQGRGACHGDSGGPAYLVDSSGKTLLVGVTSHGTNPQGLCDRQAVYTGIMGYAQWIQDGLKEFSSMPLAAQ